MEKQLNSENSRVLVNLKGTFEDLENSKELRKTQQKSIEVRQAQKNSKLLKGTERNSREIR